MVPLSQRVCSALPMLQENLGASVTYTHTLFTDASLTNNSWTITVLSNSVWPAVYQSWAGLYLQSAVTVSSIYLRSPYDIAAGPVWTSLTPTDTKCFHQNTVQHIIAVHNVDTLEFGATWWCCIRRSSMDTTTSFWVSSSLPASALLEPRSTKRSCTMGCSAGIAEKQCKHSQVQTNSQQLSCTVFNQ